MHVVTDCQHKHTKIMTQWKVTTRTQTRL